MEYELVLWDLDGTLIDTSPGVFHCLEQTFQELNLPIPPVEVLRKFIGPPLMESFSAYSGLEQDQVAGAVRLFREKYQGEQLFQAVVYEGLTDLMDRLKADGVKMAVTTMKPESSSKPLLEHLGLMKYFDALCCGAEDESGEITKADLVRQAMDVLNMPDPFKILLIGDSKYDAQGAQACRVDFAVALYGFGFTEEQARETESVFIAETPNDLADLFYIRGDI